MTNEAAAFALKSKIYYAGVYKAGTGQLAAKVRRNAFSLLHFMKH